MLSSEFAPATKKRVMSDTLCGESVPSRRGLLASLWSIVSVLTAVSFLTAIVYATTSNDYENGYYYDNNGDEKEEDPELAVTSRALAFSALWTAVLAAIRSVFGTVILGFQSPISGQYY